MYVLACPAHEEFLVFRCCACRRHVRSLKRQKGKHHRRFVAVIGLVSPSYECLCLREDANVSVHYPPKDGRSNKRRMCIQVLHKARYALLTMANLRPPRSCSLLSTASLYSHLITLFGHTTTTIAGYPNTTVGTRGQYIVQIRRRRNIGDLGALLHVCRLKSGEKSIMPETATYTPSFSTTHQSFRGYG